jgi:hypothetical protein
MIRTWRTAVSTYIIGAALAAGAVFTAAAVGQAPSNANLGDRRVGPPGLPSQQSTVHRPLAAKEFRGRLPPHFGQVVTEEQRQRIYAIQKEYADRIAFLKTQLEALEGERDARVYGVLTPPQRQQLEMLKRQSPSKNLNSASAQRWPLAPTGGAPPVGP